MGNHGKNNSMVRIFVDEYAQKFTCSTGTRAKSFRIALGALIIKERLGTSDSETVEQIRENPCLQYFLGLSGYSNARPFDSSMFVYFRKRIGVNPRK
ncbi:MAG: transposase [Microcoleus sp. PH2017_20_SFW_D_A]|nr:transposase [Microcoleus sp. PH2017_19_SFW_U_A]MCC3525518.1 transposase [Microcoleus sp. PH2017_20_SFW_D_A]MCC3556379.1 transposase [Microcoleus sp. PH2017_35_SFW_U_B]